MPCSSQLMIIYVQMQSFTEEAIVLVDLTNHLEMEHAGEADNHPGDAIVEDLDGIADLLSETIARIVCLELGSA